ncbi:MAG: DUF3761 domain-containing protein [Steroidobacteraceae bacterium]
MKKTNFIGVLAAPLLMFALTLPSHADSTATTTCKDGTTSTAKGKGACSGHGGVQKTTAAASPGTTGAMSQAAPAATTAAAPAGATAKCKDGTYSTSKSHSGACSKHGGVADWLTAAK